LTEERGSTLVMTLNRPEARNAVNLAMARQVAAALDVLDGRDDLTVGVLAGTGGTFCSGLDLKAFLAGEDRPVIGDRGFCGLAGRPPVKPMIAAVEGYALAGGFELVLACDLVVAADDASFGLPEVRRGLTANAGGLFRLPHRIPWHLAMEYILTGERLSAPRAAELGLVNRLAPPGGARDGALALAEVIGRNGPLAVAASKQVALQSLDWTQAESFERQEAVVDPVRRSDDAREGAAAFAEKREPVWRGR
jgi:enoyl-CoA hydratase